MHIALYQSYKCHTEVLGFLLDALAGHVVTIYNDPEHDSATFLSYYEHHFGVPLDVRSCHRLTSDLEAIDKVIMVTADDEINPWILQAHAEKMVLIQHGRTWWHTGLPCHGGLCPYAASPFMFPVYSRPTIISHPIPHRSEYLHFAVVGHVTETKHCDEMFMFLTHMPNTRLTFFARQHSDQVASFQHHPSFAGRVHVRLNLPTHELASALQSDDIDAIWVPVRRDVEHSNFKLTGALPLSYNLQKLLIVPDMIADAYRLDGAVVYESGVDGLRDMLRGWDSRTDAEWRDMSARSTDFVTRTVTANKLLLDQMLHQGHGAVQT